MKISVCVTTYNQENYIEECLASIVSQQVDFEYEILVADDCSKDRTVEIINKYASLYPDKIIPILRTKNVGALRNFVLTHNAARGVYVCHCDGDDRWLPNKLQIQADFLDSNLEYSVVWSRVNFFDDAGRMFPGEKYDYSMFKNGVVKFEDGLKFGSVAAHCSIMYRASLRKTRDPNLELVDTYYSWEFLSQGDGKILDNVLAEYRIGSIGAITVNSGSRMKKINAAHAKLFLEKFPEHKKSIFMFSLLNFIADLKHRRITAVYFLRLIFSSFTLVSVFELYAFIHSAKKIRVPDLKGE